MHDKKIRFKLGMAIVFFVLSFKRVRAVTAPDFPACANPRGSLIISYENGVHGIVGSSAQYIGEDAVYRLDDTRYLQCFCAVDGQGIQTNWWRISSMNQNQIESFKKLGWHFVPDGSVWGLDSDPFMATNANYDCGQAPTSTPTRSSSDSGGSYSGADSGVGGPNGEVLGASTSILGLAATGKSVIVLSFLIAGLVFIIAGQVIRRSSRR